MHQQLNQHKIKNYMELHHNFIKIFNKCLEKLCPKNNLMQHEFYYII